MTEVSQTLDEVRPAQPGATSMLEARFPTIGEVFVGRYRIDTIIGAGGFSQVYRARQTDLGRDVAIKVLKPVTDPSKTPEQQLAKFEQVARRFQREAKLISRLKDRNTVVMYDYGRTAGDLLYMVLEYVDGKTISELVMTDGPLAAKRAVKILRQALQSLHEAHSMGVLHRDIKPGNIMVYDHVGQSDLVKVLDFGIAKTVDDGTGSKPSTGTNSDVTADGVLVGTPRYMSPEQIRGKSLGPASDIYSLGLVMYEMLMGIKAVNADSSLRIIARHLDTDPILVPLDLALPARLREIVNKMMLKDASVRYGSCLEVLADLEQWDNDPAPASESDPTMTVDASAASRMDIETPLGGERRRPWLPIGIALLAVTIVGMLLVSSLSGRDDAEAVLRPEPVAVANPEPVEARVIATAGVPPLAERASQLLAASRTAAEQAAQATAEIQKPAPPKPKKAARKTRRKPKPKRATKDETNASKPVKVRPTKLKAFDLENY